MEIRKGCITGRILSESKDKILQERDSLENVVRYLEEKNTELSF